jgi:hypothetical protein
MTLCSITLVAGCQKCPIVTVCPLKGIIGDYQKPEQPSTDSTRHPTQGKK